MRRRKDFIGDIKHLHKCISAEIVALMVDYGVYSVQVSGDVMIPLKTGQGYIKANVNKVWYDREECQLKLSVFDGIPSEVSSNDFNRMVPCNGLEKVYNDFTRHYRSNGWIFRVMGKSYQEFKEMARQEAKEWQEWHNTNPMSYEAIEEAHRRFERLARRYGLTREFRENCII